MTNFLNILTLIVKLLPLIKEAVLSLETAFPDSGKGAEKKAILNAMIDNAIKVSGDAASIYEMAKPTISVLIDAVAKFVKKPEAV